MDITVHNKLFEFIGLNMMENKINVGQIMIILSYKNL
jgi:hypothetical protein